MWSRTGFFAVLLTSLTTQVVAADPIGPNPEELVKTVEKGVNFLKTSQQPDGSWTHPQALGVSGLVLNALLQSGVPETDPVVQASVKNLLSFRQPDGGLYNPKSSLSNYETSIALLALNAANKSGELTETIKNAEKFIRKIQWDESETIEQGDVKWGGSGYGQTRDRPDLSNTVFFLEALQATGATKDDPAVKNALTFLSRCQNLETEYNTTPHAAKVNDGGFYYTPAGGGNSPAGKTPEGGLRSYGTMTYAGLKSMVYAGLTPADPRVKAATTWIKKFYSVTENPGMGEQGLYYYYHMFAKALATMELDLVQDAEGKLHDWRKELATHLAKEQKPNGSWVNSNARWYEGDPNLCTAFALLSLKNCQPPLARTGSEKR